jgi:hypothetical protein
MSVLGDTIVNVYVPLQTGKEMWDALEAKYGVSDAGSELYVMEQFHDYRMVDDHSVVEQAHKIQLLAKEFEIFGCVLLDKFVAGSIIAKLPQAWTDFATSLKHKRQEFDIADLIGSLEVEENARAKDICGKKIIEGNSSAHVVQKILKTPTRKNSNKNSNKITLHLLRRRRIRKRKIVSLVANLSIMLRIVRMASRSPRRNMQT